jgi:hypothetical protein
VPGLITKHLSLGFRELRKEILLSKVIGEKLGRSREGRERVDDVENGRVTEQELSSSFL